VKNFGVVGNGIADDTAAIQSAINAASSNGGTVLIPEGTYLISGGNLLLKSNVCLMGVGPRSILKLGNAAANHLLRGSTITDARVTNLLLDGNEANQTANRNALNFDDVQRVQIDHLWIRNAYGDGVYVNFGRDVTISDIIGESIGRNGIALVHNSGMGDNTVISNCVFTADPSVGSTPTDNRNAGVDIEASAHVQISNVTVDGFRYGFACKSVSGNLVADVTATNLELRNCTTNGVFLDGSTGKVERIQIAGLSVVGFNAAAGSAVRVLEEVEDFSIGPFVVGAPVAGTNAIALNATTIQPTSGNIGPGVIEGTGWTSHAINVLAATNLTLNAKSSGGAGSGVRISTGTGIFVAGRYTGHARYGVEIDNAAADEITVCASLDGNTLGRYANSSTNQVSILDSNKALIGGEVEIEGAINHDGTTIGFNGTAPVAKSTGWGAPTGTATKTTFDTATVTLPQLAERTKALLDYLISRGDIGA